MKSRIIKYLQTHSLESQSIMWMLCACVCSSIMANITKYVASSMPPLEMVFFRNISAVMCLLPWALGPGIKHIRTANFRLYFSRSFSSFLAMSMFFSALAIIPVTDAVAITFTVPLMTTLLAMIFLKEKVGRHRWVALLVGFSGVIIILRPGNDAFQLASLLVLGCTVGWSISNILIKKLSHTEHPRAMVFIMMSIMVPLTLPGAIMVWKTPEIKDLIWVFILGWVTNEAQFCMNKAYKHADMGIVMPFDFSRLVFTSLIAYIFLAEILDIWTAIGAVVIFSSSVYIARHESRLRKLKALSGLTA